MSKKRQVTASILALVAALSVIAAFGGVMMMAAQYVVLGYSPGCI